MIQSTRGMNPDKRETKESSVLTEKHMVGPKEDRKLMRRWKEQTMQLESDLLSILGSKTLKIYCREEGLGLSF